MESFNIFLLTAIVFVPALGAILLAFIPKDNEEVMRFFTLGVTFVVLLLTIVLGLNFQRSGEAAAWMQNTFNVAWIPSFGIDYYMGIDGISLPLIILTSFISFLAMAASWSIKKHVKAYCILFLLLEMGMLGVFVSLDFFLFYVFWEVMLLPMYFLIGVWGGPRREYAAIKFFLYTLVGSVLMLIAILVLFFHSDLHQVVEKSNFYPGAENAAVEWDKLHVNPRAEQRLGKYTVTPRDADGEIALYRREKGGEMLIVRFQKSEADLPQDTTSSYEPDDHLVTVYVHEDHDAPADVVAAIQGNADLEGILSAAVVGEPAEDVSVLPDETTDYELAVVEDEEVHSFNLLALAAMGQHTKCIPPNVQIWCFILLFIGFAIKVPSVPFHTWLPDAHVEAPTPISMILAGVLLKMGGYGIIRICYPICPIGGYELALGVCLIGAISMVYGGFAALAQKDFKRMVAYSSVSHMGYVVLGLGIWSMRPDMWNMGITGAMFQMIGHGVSSAGMFFMVGVIYDRVHHRNLNEFGGLFGKMPTYTALSIGIFFAGLGLPGLCGFIGEAFVVISVWSFSWILAVIAASVVILTAAYILWAIQRVYLGAEYKGPNEEKNHANQFPGTLYRQHVVCFRNCARRVPLSDRD